MTGIEAHNLEKGKTYRFSVHHNILENEDDRLPHYYEATYIGRKSEAGPKKAIWLFKDFTDTETGEIKKITEVKHLGLLHPVFELIGGRKRKMTRRKMARRKMTRRKMTRRKN